MSPQNWLCRSERNPALDTHGDNAYSPQIPDTKLTVTSKVQFLQLQHVFRQIAKNTIPHVRLHTLPSQPSQLLITQFRLNTHNLSRILQHQKQTQIFHAANKNLFIKTPFDYRHLASSSSSFYFLTTISEGPYKRSEETTQRKHTYVTPIFLANNKLSLATNKPTSPAKMILQTSDNLLQNFAKLDWVHFQVYLKPFS